MIRKAPVRVEYGVCPPGAAFPETFIEIPEVFEVVELAQDARQYETETGQRLMLSSVHTWEIYSGNLSGAWISEMLVYQESGLRRIWLRRTHANGRLETLRNASVSLITELGRSDRPAMVRLVATGVSTLGIEEWLQNFIPNSETLSGFSIVIGSGNTDLGSSISGGVGRLYVNQQSTTSVARIESPLTSYPLSARPTQWPIIVGLTHKIDQVPSGSFMNAVVVYGSQWPLVFRLRPSSFPEAGPNARLISHVPLSGGWARSIALFIPTEDFAQMRFVFSARAQVLGIYDGSFRDPLVILDPLYTT